MTKIKVDEIVMSGDIQTQGAKIIALDCLNQVVEQHNQNCKVFPGCEVFGAKNAKVLMLGAFEVSVALVKLPSKIKAVVDVNFIEYGDG